MNDPQKLKTTRVEETAWSMTKNLVPANIVSIVAESSAPHHASLDDF